MPVTCILSGPGQGKTTGIVKLATDLALIGKSVIVMSTEYNDYTFEKMSKRVSCVAMGMSYKQIKNFEEAIGFMIGNREYNVIMLDCINMTPTQLQVLNAYSTLSGVDWYVTIQVHREDNQDLRTITYEAMLEESAHE